MAKMMKTSFVGILAVMSLGSCRELPQAAAVLAGNFANGHGQYQKAILRYLEAEDEMSAGLDIVYYNLGNVYYSLGEPEAALHIWALAEKATDDVDVLFRIAFNRGLVYFNWGRYEEASQSFKWALRYNPADIDSKINLEDALSHVRSEIPRPAEKREPSTLTVSDNLLLEYIKRKEADVWTSPEAETSNVQDW